MIMQQYEDIKAGADTNKTQKQGTANGVGHKEAKEKKNMVAGKMKGNGTSFFDESWKKWYGHKSNKERMMDREERED